MQVVPDCVNHARRLAVGVIQTDAGTERYVCENCADRFWALADSPTCTATLTYLRLDVDVEAVDADSLVLDRFP